VDADVKKKTKKSAIQTVRVKIHLKYLLLNFKLKNKGSCESDFHIHVHWT